MFMHVSLQSPEELTDDEITKTIKLWKEDEFLICLRTLGKFLKNNSEDNKNMINHQNVKTEIWNKKIKPWLDKYWPQDGSRNTGNTSAEIVRSLLLNSAQAFPEVVSWSLPYLKPIRTGYRTKKDLIKQDPEGVLKVLDKIVDKENLGDCMKREVKKTLDLIIKEIKPDLSNDTKFKNLYRLV